MDCVAAPDPELVDRACAGDLAAFALLVTRNRDRLIRYATHMLGSIDDAEEAVQDALVRAHRALGRCERDRFDAWLFRIVVNRCRTTAQRRRWWRRWATPLTPDGAVVPHPEGDAAWAEEISRALAILPPEQREAFLLKHVDDLSYQEMHRLTGVSISALKMRVSRACDRMRRELTEAT